MKTPIIDFVEKYISKNVKKLHMPGHKGVGPLGFEAADITEIPGADSLFEADGIIAQSEQNASGLFGCHTFYSTEGSSHTIRAMLYLALQGKDKRPLVLVGRNAHKAFLTAAALLDFDVDWLTAGSDYLSCPITPTLLRNHLKGLDRLPDALYFTSPDYLGNTLDIKGLSQVAKEFSLPLLVDNAHGAYLKFLNPSRHPIDLGATMCCDSAHKTLPVLTGGAYLHVAADEKNYALNAKTALSLFGSTSPSYLILQSLDGANKYLEALPNTLAEFLPKLCKIRLAAANHGYTLIGDEPMKITLATKPLGYTGTQVAEKLADNNIVVEFFDCDYVTLMPTPQNSDADLNALTEALLSLPKQNKEFAAPPKFSLPKVALSPRAAIMSQSEEIPLGAAVGRITAMPTIGCPPAVPITVSGEIIDENTIKIFEYYGIKTLKCILNKGADENVTHGNRT